MNKIDSIAILQDWYECNCNNDWEHQYGIKIETMDNPGWSIHIDTKDTLLEGISFSLNKENGFNWCTIVAENNVFKGYGSNLSEIIQIFYSEFLLPNLRNTQTIFTLYFEIINGGTNVWRPIFAIMVDLKKFKIVEIPNIELGELLVNKTEDWKVLDLTKIPNEIPLIEGMIVKCDLENLCDGVVLVVNLEN